MPEARTLDGRRAVANPEGALAEECFSFRRKALRKPWFPSRKGGGRRLGLRRGNTDFRLCGMGFPNLRARFIGLAIESAVRSSFTDLLYGGATAKYFPLGAAWNRRSTMASEH